MAGALLVLAGADAAPRCGGGSGGLAPARPVTFHPWLLGAVAINVAIAVVALT